MLWVSDDINDSCADGQVLRCLTLADEDTENFASGREARVVLEQWSKEHNEQRPHGEIGHLTPSERPMNDMDEMDTMKRESRLT